MDALSALVGLLVVLVVIAIVLLVRLLRATKAPAINESTVAATVMTSLSASGLQRDLGEVKQLASQMARSTQDLQRVFQVQQQRGSLGEQQLEAILRDLVPPDRLHVRSNIALIGTPDVAIRMREGLVCIDSKFPLDQYRELVNAGDGERDTRSRAFLRNVRSHLDAIASKYVRPDVGTAPFAMAFIPSEAVYTFIHQADPGLGSEYARRGVLLASPSTLTTHVALIGKGLQAEVLSQCVELVQRALQRLDRELGAVREEWSTMRRHVKNANEQSQKVENAIDGLDKGFQAAAKLDVKGPSE